MNQKDLLNQVLEVLRARGGEGDAYLEERQSLNLSVREGRLEEIRRAGVRGLGVRAMHEGRLGFVHTSAVNPQSARDAAEKALELARAATPRDDLMIPDPMGPGDGSDEGASLGIFDPEIEKRAIQEKEEYARTAEAVARAYDPKVKKTEGAGYAEDRTGIWIANTKGLFRHCRRTHLEVHANVVAEDGDEKQVGEVGVESTRWDGLPSPDELGRRSGERAVRLLGGRAVETGRFPVIFTPDTGWTLLLYIATALRGDHLSRKRSWLADRIDPTIGSSIVTVRDNARLPGGPATMPFDGEGVDTQDIALIEQGKIAGNLCDLAAAKRMGVASTGSSRRGGYAALPGIGNSNLYLAPGSMKPEEIISGVEKGLLVWGLSGWWIGLDPSNPQFSSAASGLWIENGKPTRPVARVTVGGGIEAILHGIDQIADDLVWEGPTRTPTFRVGAMSISGT